MKKELKKLLFAGVSILTLATSCETEDHSDEAIQNTQSSNLKVNNDLLIKSYSKEKLSIIETKMVNDFPDFESLVEESACSGTAFNVAANETFNEGYDVYAQLYYSTYAAINQYSTYLDNGPQYFGEDGEYTNLVKNRQRSLEKFWDMGNEVVVNGQHNATLGDPEKIAAVYRFLGYPAEIAAANAQAFLQINDLSTFLIENPLLSFDGFATILTYTDGSTKDLIVIGDGIVEVAVKAGVDDKVVWSGILSHEWAHQIQFNNFDEWYPEGAADNAPEATRYTELEADFFTGYYLTHKRGATYNWKSAQEFFELFFNIGDCSFTNSGHHGTPLQRMRAAEAGYELAKSAQKNGHILSQEEVHEIFVSTIDSIISGK